ncbi:MAG TPA: hypothetical protein VFZ83_15210 [Acidimicrobiia bacterium]|nr:hypothetical protein [Acidimicrobiia bacterium]
MASQRTTFGKLQRERAKRAKAAAKREKRHSRGEEGDELGEESEPLDLDAGPELSAPELLKLIEELHARFDAGRIPFEDFEEQKADLFERLSKLPID